MLGVEAARLLEWYMVAGVEVATAPAAVNHFASLKKSSSATLKTTQPPIQAQNFAQPSGADEAQITASRASNFEELQQAIGNFALCGLKQTANSTLLGVGNIAAKILIIGDVPSAEDDANAKIFSDASGELLHKMLRAIDVDLSEHCFLTNISPWRTPVNRLLNADEVGLCTPFIRRHIELAPPHIIISLGATPTTALIGKNIGINNLRGEPSMYGDINIFTTYHPSVLLKNPAFKRNAWQDLLAIKAHLNF